MSWVRAHWALIIIVGIGGIARFLHPDWDAGGRLHPDEALIVNGALAVKFFSNLFPGFHDYNGLSPYLLRLIAPDIVSAEHLTVIGRMLSATLGTIAIFLTYLIGKRWWNARIGVIAALIIATTPLLLQLSHFYTTENILITLLLLLTLAAPSPIRMAIPMGLLLATKNTAYLFLPVPFAILMLSSYRTPVRMLRSILLFASLTLLIFFFASPYSFLDYGGYLSRSRYLTDVVSGRLLMDWTMQFQETTPLFWLPTMAYALGPITLLSVVGSIGALHLLRVRRVSSLFALGSLAFLVFLSVTYLKFARYIAPVIPFLSLFGAKLLTDLTKTTPGKAIAYFLIAAQVLYGIMFVSIYATPHTSLTATEWIRTHVPDGSTILVEEWNSIIRFTRPELSDKTYTVISFNFHTLPDTESKYNRLTDALNRSDYILLESPKVKNMIRRLSARYPRVAPFYDSLENGSLGFTKVMTFTSYPRMGFIAINDESAEETFTVFDHPTITVFRKRNR